MMYILCVVHVWERKKTRKRGGESHILIMRVLSLSVDLLIGRGEKDNTPLWWQEDIRKN